MPNLEDESYNQIKTEFAGEIDGQEFDDLFNAELKRFEQNNHEYDSEPTPESDNGTEPYNTHGYYDAETDTVYVDGMELQGDDYEAIQDLKMKFRDEFEGLAHQKTDEWNGVTYESNYYIEGRTLRIETIITSVEEDEKPEENQEETHEAIEQDYVGENDTDPEEQSQFSLFNAEAQAAQAVTVELDSQFNTGQAQQVEISSVWSSWINSPEPSGSINTKALEIQNRSNETPIAESLSGPLVFSDGLTRRDEQIPSFDLANFLGMDVPVSFESKHDDAKTQVAEKASSPDLKNIDSVAAQEQDEETKGTAKVATHAEVEITEHSALRQPVVKVDTHENEIDTASGEKDEKNIDTTEDLKPTVESAGTWQAYSGNILGKETLSGAIKLVKQSERKEVTNPEKLSEIKPNEESLSNEEIFENEPNEKDDTASSNTKAASNKSKPIIKLAGKTPDSANAIGETPPQPILNLDTPPVTESVPELATKNNEDESPSPDLAPVVKNQILPPAEPTEELPNGDPVFSLKETPEDDSPELSQPPKTNLEQTPIALEPTELKLVKPKFIKTEHTKEKISAIKEVAKEIIKTRLEQRAAIRLVNAERAKKTVVEISAVKKESNNYTRTRQIKRIVVLGPKLERSAITLRRQRSVISSEERDRLESANRIVRIPRNAVRRRIPNQNSAIRLAA